MCVQASVERNILWYVSGSRAHHGAQHHPEVSFWDDSQAACSRAECRWGGDQQGPAPACLSLQGQNQGEVQPPSGVTGDQPFLTAFLHWCQVATEHAMLETVVDRLLACCSSFDLGHLQEQFNSHVQRHSASTVSAAQICYVVTPVLGSGAVQKSTAQLRIQQERHKTDRAHHGIVAWLSWTMSSAAMLMIGCTNNKP